MIKLKSNGCIGYGSKKGAQHIMRLEISEDRLKIYAETEQDSAYMRDTLGLTDKGNYILMRFWKGDGGSNYYAIYNDSIELATNFTIMEENKNLRFSCSSLDKENRELKIKPVKESAKLKPTLFNRIFRWKDIINNKNT